MASALEQFVNNVRTLSLQGNFVQLCEYLNISTEILVKNSAHLDNVLATLDLQQHSLGILAILCVKLSLPNIQDIEPLYAQVTEFITSSNGEQVRVGTNLYADLCHLYAQTLVERKQPIRGIDLLCRAIRKIQLFPSQLTSIHADLCQLCLLAKCMKPALEFLDLDVTDISKENGKFEAKHFLLYYYYAGMIYTALKNYGRALYFFEVAITTPSLAVSHIMLEAYKKYILVSLILHGKDNHMGLVMQCIASLYKKNIQRLTKTFLTLSLSDMANRVQLSGPKEAEQYILHMIEDGEIYATINQKDGMVIFHDNPEKYNSPEMLKCLEEEMRKCIVLDEKLRQMDEEITINSQYVKKCGGVQDDDLPGTSGGMSGGKIPYM
uniref:COP9 signalosome complex subunit 3 n=1 Tax=Strigamia maritima TaxID=126957 RepID=T1ITU9_STRMM